MRRPSLKIRITAWFALMMFVIEALVLSFLLAVNGTIVTNDPESRLVRSRRSFRPRSRCRSAGMRCAPSLAASRRFMSMMCTST